MYSVQCEVENVQVRHSLTSFKGIYSEHFKSQLQKILCHSYNPEGTNYFDLNTKLN